MLGTEATRLLAEFVVSTGSDELDEGIRDRANASIADCVAVMLAGRSSTAGGSVIEYVRETSVGNVSDWPCWAVGLLGGAPPEAAALVNATCAHALDYDDTLPGGGHLTAVVLPAILATADSAGLQLGGPALTEAFAIGFEVAAKVAAALGVAHYFKGWHTTSTAGSFGAAAAACKVLSLDASRVATAFGIVGSLTGGMQLNFGTATKALHAGIAARNGVAAALLAERGFTASRSIFDGPHGLLALYGAGAAVPKALDLLGAPWALAEPGAALKPYPCCYAAARSACAALQFATTYSYAPAEITSVVSKVPKGGLQALIYDDPQTGLNGKASMQYILAAALIDRELTLETFTDAAVQRPAVRDLMLLVSSSEDRMLRLEDPDAKLSAPTVGGRIELTVETADGSSRTLTVNAQPGSADLPMSAAEVRSKALACVRFGGYDDRRAQRLLLRLGRLDAESDISTLLRHLTGDLPTADFSAEAGDAARPQAQGLAPSEDRRGLAGVAAAVAGHGPEGGARIA